MKRFLLITNLLLLFAVAFISFNSKRTAAQQDPIPYRTCINCPYDDFYGLPVDTFMRGIARYRSFHWKIISPRMRKSGGVDGDPEFQDARACWYPIDTLKKFICLIEKYADTIGIKSPQLGIRFYYAVYANDRTAYGNYRRHHTLFMVPTYHSNEPDDNIDFDPRYNVAVQRRLPAMRRGTSSHWPDSIRPISLAGMYAQNPHAPVLSLSGLITPRHGNLSSTQVKDGLSSSAVTMAKNQGQLCPPNCPHLAPTTLDNADQIPDSVVSN